MFFLNDGRSALIFEENMVFENFWWGIWVQANSGGCYKLNKICDNKMGGVRVCKRSPGMPPCVVDNNTIHDNCGPAIYEGLLHFELYSFPKKLQMESMKQLIEKYMTMHSGSSSIMHVHRGVSIPNAVSATFMFNECFQNEKGMTKLQTKVMKTNCAFCFRSGSQLKSCKRCMTTRYCGKECQKMHWGRHKYLFQAKGQISTVEVSIPVCPSGFVLVKHVSTNPGLELNGPNYASPPPRNGSRFIVKLQTSEGLLGETLDYKGYVSDDYDPNKASITIYDRSHYVDFNIAGQPRRYHLIMECGMMGASMYLSKKLFCWAAFKDGKTIPIFTHELPPVQKW